MASANKSKIVKGVRVSMCLTEDEGLSVEDGGKYVLMCEAHGGIIQDDNKARLWSQANEVEIWCEEHDAQVGA